MAKKRHGGEHLMTPDGPSGSPGTGYEKVGDKIWPAPCVSEQMGEMSAREMGLQAYIAAMNRYLVEQFRVLATDRKRWWDEARRMYGLDPDKAYQWYDSDQHLEPVPEQKKEPSAESK